LIAEIMPSDAEIPEQYKGIEQESSALEVRVQGLIILTEEDHGAACHLERQMAEQEKVIAAEISPAKEAAHQAHRRICELEKRLAGPIARARPLLKSKIADYRRKAREAAERAAAAAREAARKQAEDEALLRAEALQNRGEPERAAAVIAHFTPPAVAISTRKPEAHGVTTREVWNAAVDDKLALIAWVAERPVERHVYLLPDLSALSGQAKLFKADLRIPGVRSVRRDA
jgi:hypothetical protein